MLPGTASSHARTRRSSEPCFLTISCNICQKKCEWLHFSCSSRGSEATASDSDPWPMFSWCTKLCTIRTFSFRRPQVLDPDSSAWSKVTTGLAVALLRPLICLKIRNWSFFDASGSKRGRLVPNCLRFSVITAPLFFLLRCGAKREQLRDK